MTNTVSADYGDLEVIDGRAVVRFTRRLDHGPEAVWRALTEPEQLAAWFPTTIDGERAAGADLEFRFEQVEMPPMTGKMLAFEPPSLLELSWGGDRVRFELTPEGDGTRLVFTATMEELGKATRDGAGWHQCLDSLERGLADAPARPDDSDRWRALRDVYAERFGPEASVLGPPKEWEDAHGEA
jgi:uncharacterized protein YndB with AHSA1/START domain